MRKGYMLIEVLVVLAILAVFFLVITEPLRNMTLELPRTYRDFQTFSILSDMLRNLQTDVESAVSLEEDSQTPGLLVIRTTTGTVRYMLEPDNIVKTYAGYLQDPSVEVQNTWLVPHAVITWRLRQKNGQGYALEVSTHIERTVLGRLENKFNMSYLFYAGSAPPKVENVCIEQENQAL